MLLFNGRTTYGLNERNFRGEQTFAQDALSYHPCCTEDQYVHFKPFLRSWKSFYSVRNKSGQSWTDDKNEHETGDLLRHDEADIDIG